MLRLRSSHEGIPNLVAGAKPQLFEQLLVDDRLMEVVSEYLNEIHARHLAEKDVPLAKTTANMRTDRMETPALTTKEPA